MTGKSVFNVIAMLILGVAAIGHTQPQIVVDTFEIDLSPFLLHEDNNEFDIEILNIGNQQLSFSISITYIGDNREDYLSVDPDRGVVDPGGFMFPTLFWNVYGMHHGHNNAEIHIHNNTPEMEDVVIRFHAEWIWPHRVHIASGWSLVSIPVILDDFNNRNQLPHVLGELLENESLIMVKDGQGRFYYPAEDFNNIPFWNFREGYYVRMSREDSFIIVGEPAAPDTPIPLRQGWNMVAYFPEEELEAPDAFTSIEDVLIIAKDGRGRIYYPEADFNNMPPLRRELGYMVRVRQETELIWIVP